MKTADENAFGHEIRSMLEDALAGVSRPLTAADIVERATEIRLDPPLPAHPERARVWLVATLAAAAVLVATLLVGRTNDVTPTAPTSPARVGRYFIPTWLPEGYVLLNAEESTSVEYAATTTALFRRINPPARLEISTDTLEAEPQFDANAQRFTLDDGAGSWTRIRPISTDGRSLDGVMIEIVRGRAAWRVQGWGIDRTDDAVTALARQISVDEAGLPIVDSATGFRLEERNTGVGGSPTGRYALTYGLPGTAESVTVRAERGPAIAPAQISAGSFASRSMIAGHEVWGDDSDASWMAAPDLRLSVTALPDGSLDQVVAGLQEVDGATFDREFHRVGERIPTEQSWPVLLAGTELRFDTIGTAEDRGLCLSTGSGARRCVYPVAEHLRGRYDATSSWVSIVIGDRWYIIVDDPDLISPTMRAVRIGDLWSIVAVDPHRDTIRLGVGAATRDLLRPLR